MANKIKPYKNLESQIVIIIGIIIKNRISNEGVDIFTSSNYVILFMATTNKGLPLPGKDPSPFSIRFFSIHDYHLIYLI